MGGRPLALRRRKQELPSLQGTVKRRVTQPAMPLAMKLPNLLSVEAVAAAIHRHPEVVRRQARDGRLPGEKIGRVWFFRPERLAEAGFSQFLPQMAGDSNAVLPGEPSVTPLLKALGEAGLQALQHLDRPAIFAAVATRLADAGLSTYFFDGTPDGSGLTIAYVHALHAAAEVARLTGREEVGTFIPFERVPVLHRACSTLKPQYIGDHDELVGRVAMVLQPEASANARRLSELLQMSAVISAPLVVGDQAIGAITVIGAGLRESDLPAVMAFANQTAAAIETARLLQESREMEEAMVLTLAGAIELREALRSRAYEHATLAERLAEHLGFDPARRRRVRYAALLQDFGKINLPDSILRKRGRLDAEERALMMTHPVVAADVLQRFKPLTDLAPIVRAHHEWFNGEGYPDGLKAEAIPIETRIISVVNAFFNVTFDLPLKTEQTVAEGLEELTRFAGINLDPKITEALVVMCREAGSRGTPWYDQLLVELFASHSAPTGVKDILSVADSRELRIIYRIARETTAVLDLDTLLSRIVTIIREVMGYKMVSIFLPVNSASELRVGAQSGYSADITGLTLPIGQGIIGWVYTHGVPQIMADVALMSAVGSQLASCLEVAQLHDTLKREASHDPLTRLNNRRHFLERIQQEITRAGATGESFSIVFLDVDELKRINDTYGHLAGDALLREVSNALMDAVRGEDVVARYGGDEFVVLLPATPAAAAASVVQRISDGIVRHRFMAGRELLQIPGVSLGLANFPQDGKTAEDLLASADATLYRQKRRAS